MKAALSDAHERHVANLRRLPAILDAEGLRIGTQYVMFFAEAELMGRHADQLLTGTPDPDILEVGLGLGVFAEQLVGRAIGSYTAIEPHEGIANLAKRLVLNKLDTAVTVHTEPWQLVSLPTASYDAIMYDTWPPDGHADSDFAIFVERVAVPCLRPGGRFSFFHSGDRLIPARCEVLDAFFRDWETTPFTMPATDVPTNWTKTTTDFLIPIATKGDQR
jgi:spermidine synthase